MMIEFREGDQVSASDSLSGSMMVGEVISLDEEEGNILISIELENGRTLLIQKYKSQQSQDKIAASTAQGLMNGP